MKKFLVNTFFGLLFLASIPLGLIIFFSIFGNPLGVTNTKLIGEANKFAIYEAVEFQKYLEEEGNCPLNLESWNSLVTLGEYQFQKNIQDSKESIPVYYSCKDDLTFSIWVRYGIDSDLSIKGGQKTNLEITYGHFSDPKKLIIDSSLDKSELNRLLLNEKLIEGEHQGVKVLEAKN
jgi:hypothetical protein